MKPHKNTLFPAIISVFLLLFACSTPQQSASPPHTEASQSPPNILLILADDLGYGDVSFLNPASKIQTPHIDQLAAEGTAFLDAHSPCAVCTPTRYGILTGRYSWRSRMERGVLLGYSPTLIESDRTTLASMLKAQGYTTGCVGKWHLGVNWTLKNGNRPGESWEGPYNRKAHDPDPENIDFTQPVSGGPQGAGFDYSFILPASLDFEPYCYLENNQLVTAPTDSTPGNDLTTGYTGAFWRPGKMAPDFEFDQVLPTFIQQSQQFISQASQTDDPFFLYLPLAAPHTPWVPTEDYRETAAAGTYGDFVHMVDDYVGKLLSFLEEQGMKENTLVIFTSDNGPYWKPDFIERFDHRAAHHFRGMKADIWEGGHRIPLIVRWPGQINAGVQRNDLTSLTDIMATCAAVVGAELDSNTGEDSYNMLSAWLNQNLEAPIRNEMVVQSSNGTLALRQGPWKLIPMRGSGGFSDPRVYEPQNGEAQGQLYNLQEDIGETQNRYLEFPDRVKKMNQTLTQIKQNP